MPRRSRRCSARTSSRSSSRPTIWSRARRRRSTRSTGSTSATPAARVRHCMQAAFAGRRIVVFSGGAAKGEDAVYDDARAIRDGGGNGSIIGRNTFQRVARGRAGDARPAGGDLQGARVIALSARAWGFPARRFCHAAPSRQRDGRNRPQMYPRSRAAPRHIWRRALRHRRGGADAAISSFAALQGEHGLFSLFQIEAQETRLQERAPGLQAERAIIANRTAAASPSGSISTCSTSRRVRSSASARPDEIIDPLSEPATARTIRGFRPAEIAAIIRVVQG